MKIKKHNTKAAKTAATKALWISVVMLAVLIIAVGFFVYSSIKNGRDGDIGNGDKTAKQSSVDEGRVYQNPPQYCQITGQVKNRTKWGQDLIPGSAGLKVQMVNKRLKVNKSGHYREKTEAAVRKFQKKKGLKVTGTVDYNTWMAMGLTEKDWDTKGLYIAKCRTTKKSTREECIEVMIDQAMEYVGGNWVAGACGKPGTGVCCSGMCLQALYAAGVDPYPISSEMYYGNEIIISEAFWKSDKFKHVKFEDRERGDFIIYTRGGKIAHMAIYIGDGKTIEAYPHTVYITDDFNLPIKGVIRPFV